MSVHISQSVPFHVTECTLNIGHGGSSHLQALAGHVRARRCRLVVLGRRIVAPHFRRPARHAEESQRRFLLEKWLPPRPEEMGESKNDGLALRGVWLHCTYNKHLSSHLISSHLISSHLISSHLFSPLTSSPSRGTFTNIGYMYPSSSLSPPSRGFHPAFGGCPPPP